MVRTKYIEMLAAFLRANKVTHNELAEFIEKVRQREQKRRDKKRCPNRLTPDIFAHDIGSHSIHAAYLLDNSFIKNFARVRVHKRYFFTGIYLYLRALQKLNAQMNADKNSSQASEKRVALWKSEL